VNDVSIARGHVTFLHQHKQLTFFLGGDSWEHREHCIILSWEGEGRGFAKLLWPLVRFSGSITALAIG